MDRSMLQAPKYFRRLFVERFESRRCLTAIGFAVHDVDVNHTPHSVFPADVDGDGDQDLLTASRSSDLAWLENIDGQATFGNRKTIAFHAHFHVIGGDVDGDGDIDALATTRGNKVVWYPNVNSKGGFGPQRTIGAVDDFIRNVVAKDLEGDGDLDVIVTFRNDEVWTTVWFENLDNQGTFGAQRIITTDAWATSPADVDGDGDEDILSVQTSGIFWHENLNGRGDFGPARLIVKGDRYTSVHGTDLDGDGDLDIVSSDFRPIWIENIDGKGTFGTVHVAPPLRDSSLDQVFPADIDGDGDIDLVGTYSFNDSTEIFWFKNTDGRGMFDEGQLVGRENATRNLVISDLDGDGDAETIVPSPDELVMYRFMNGRFGNQENITKGVTLMAPFLVADVDQDGDQDILAIVCRDQSDFDFCFRDVLWYENIDGDGNFGNESIFDPNRFSHYTDHVGLHMDDIDADGDLDVVALIGEARFFLYDNVSGMGDFGPSREIRSKPTFFEWFTTGDFDADGDLDLLAGGGHGGIIWHENTDGNGSFGEANGIPLKMDGFSSFFLKDMDSDNDVDLIAISSNGRQLLWYENQDGVFGDAKVSDVPMASYVHAADVDGDGDLDAVLAGHNKIQIHENANGSNFLEGLTLDASGDRVISGDVDGDGDLDLISYSSFRVTSQISWFENIDGDGTFGSQQIVNIKRSSRDSPYSPIGYGFIVPGDYDGDGDLDLGLQHDQGGIVWLENRLVGDANGDDEFDLIDLLAVFQAGEYDDGIVGNSTFDEGDWNADGEFDSSDLVLAFQSGNFVSASKPVISAAVDFAFSQAPRKSSQFRCVSVAH